MVTRDVPDYALMYGLPRACAVGYAPVESAWDSAPEDGTGARRAGANYTKSVEQVTPGGE